MSNRGTDVNSRDDNCKLCRKKSFCSHIHRTLKWYHRALGDRLLVLHADMSGSRASSEDSVALS